MSEGLAEFLGSLKALSTMSRAELDIAGIPTDEAEWIGFRRSPYDWFITADDERQAIVWELIERDRWAHMPEPPSSGSFVRCEFCLDGDNPGAMGDAGICSACGFDGIPF